MSENPQAPKNPASPDPLASLYRMSNTAGLGSQEYVAINLSAVTAIILGLASALVLMSNVLFVIPVAAIIFAVVALRQISQSNGTQTGRGIASIGLVAALVMSAVVGIREYQTRAAIAAEQASILGTVNTLQQDILGGKYDQAYALFTERLAQEKNVNPQAFADKWKTLSSNATFGKITGLTTNGRYELSSTAADESRVAVSLLVIKFEKVEQPFRSDITFRKKNGQWLIDDIQSLFPTPGKGGN